MNEIKNDINLREAISRKEQKFPPMPSDLNERLLQRLQEEEKPSNRRTLPIALRWMAVAAVLAAVLALFTWKSQTPKSLPQNDETTAQLVPQEDMPKVIEKDHIGKMQTSNVTIANIKRDDCKHQTRRWESSQPTKKHRKAVKIQNTSEEPMLAEAESITEEAETEENYLPTKPDPYLLAAAETQDIRSRGEHLYQEVNQILINAQNIER